MAGKRTSLQEFLELKRDIPVLDVRSPGEYAKGHIPGAISFPLFTDEERAIIGTSYKKEGRETAILKGLDITGPKMRTFVEKASALKSPELALYCWRGGMRSGSMAWLLETYGLRTYVLEGGYKTFRTGMLDFFQKELPLRVICGYTGSKKTELLHQLAGQGEQVLDLEGLAGHQGSSFGNKKCQGQPSTEHFQNLIYEACREMDLDRPVWIEDENMRVGTVNMTEGLYTTKNRSPHILIEVPREQRINFLVEDYGVLPREKLVEATEAIRKKLGDKNASEAIQCIRTGDLHRAVDIILMYYDERYDRNLDQKRNLVTEKYSIRMEEIPSLAVHLATNKTGYVL